MQKVIITTLLLAIGFIIQGQDKVVDLTSFSDIRAQEGIEVELKEGSPKAEINMLEGNIEDLIVEQKGDIIRLYFKKSSKRNWFGKSENRDAEVVLYYNSEIESVDVSSGASIESNETLMTSDMSIDASSGGYISLNLEAINVDVDISSGASIELEGVTKNLEVDLSSGATFDGKKLKSKIANVDASSGASAKVWTTDEIIADASSGASVKFLGDPPKTKLDSGRWSGGSIKKM